MDKETFKLLKSILKGCEIKIEDEKEMLKNLQQQAENSKNRLFQKLKEGSLENLIELQTRTMNEMYEIAHAADIKAVYDEAKSAGYDVKYVKKMVALRKLDQDEIEEADELTQMYRNAIGL